MTSKKLCLNTGYHYYKNILKSPKYVVAPMVGLSDLPWRMMARKHGAHLCYTQMYYASAVAQDECYRNQVLKDISCQKDRPLIVQFCANTIKDFVEASLFVQDYCDGVDLNLGCPQTVAEAGIFGAFLQDEWGFLRSIISESCKHLNVGVSAKIRVREEVEPSVEYARMLEDAGCNLLAVHGRTREQKNSNAGSADWSKIKAIKENVSIPVFSNGNVHFPQDVARSMKEIGADGVMAAEGHLTNPFIFEGIQPNVYDVIDEYLSFAETYPTTLEVVRTHVHILMGPTLQLHKPAGYKKLVREAPSFHRIREACLQLRELCELKSFQDNIVPSTGLPCWTCQSYKTLHDYRVKTSIKPPILGVDRSKWTKGQRRRFFASRHRQRKAHALMVERRKEKIRLDEEFLKQIKKSSRKRSSPLMEKSLESLNKIMKNFISHLSAALDHASKWLNRANK